jgi:hypothetical protein
MDRLLWLWRLLLLWFLHGIIRAAAAGGSSSSGGSGRYHDFMSTALTRGSTWTGCCSGCGGCSCLGLGLGVGVLILVPLTFWMLTLGLRLGGLTSAASSSSSEGGAGD